MESEHDNYGANKSFHKKKPKFGNIRNFKPMENEYNNIEQIDPKQVAVNPKSQCIYPYRLLPLLSSLFCSSLTK